MSKQQDKVERLEKVAENMSETYIYIKYMAGYMWLEQHMYYKSGDAAANLLISPKDLSDLRENNVIKDYNNICYRQRGRSHCFNMLDEEKILKPSKNPVLDIDIQTLIENLCGHNQENITWLYKAILYKYSHINDYTIPCVVFFGKGGSGKGTFISLLSTIFHEENVMSNLGQRELTSSFDTYKGQKLIIEFAEIITNNTGSDKQILNKLKNIIGAEKITVNEKGVQPYQIDNIVWAIISSNSNMPILLDDKDKGNRRFSLIRSDTALKNGKEINDSVRNKEKVSNFLAWLIQEYPDVLEYEDLQALDNKDKRLLEDMSQSDSSLFWEYFEYNFPDKKGKVLKKEINMEMDTYCFDNNIEKGTFKRFFWKSSKYRLTRLRINGKPEYCVEIP